MSGHSLQGNAYSIKYVTTFTDGEKLVSPAVAQIQQKPKSAFRWRCNKSFFPMTQEQQLILFFNNWGVHLYFSSSLRQWFDLSILYCICFHSTERKFCIIVADKPCVLTWLLFIFPYSQASGQKLRPPVSINNPKTMLFKLIYLEIYQKRDSRLFCPLLK